MKLMKLFLWFSLFFMGIPSAVFGSQSAKTFLDGVSAYSKGDYDQAIENFLIIADQGVMNDKVFYNIGNAYFKTHDLGRSILWYERAYQLAPTDPDLRFNLAFARSQTKDKLEAEEGGLYRILFFWNYLLSPSTIEKIALILNGVFWLVLGINAFRNRRTSRLFGWIVSVWIVIFTLTAGYNFYEKKGIQKAIIITKEAPVRSGWTDESTELFVLHAGTKVKVEKMQKGYYRIYFSKGKIGWLSKADAELI